jgi:transcriptional regulator with XRE-family HTH domain
VMIVDTPELRSDAREFLTSRRAKITPQQAGLPVGKNRRVPGLRRTEVASLAGMSVEYYSRLERGNLAGVSEEVLEALSRALELDEAERAHLYDLARAAASRPTPRKRARPESVRQSLQATLDAITTAPAMINNGRGDVVAANGLARALFSEMFVSSSRRPVNNARFVFLDPRSTTFYKDWSKAADDTVAILRTQAGQDPHNKDLSDLVGELSTQSEEFRVRWAAHNVRQHFTGTKRVRHPAVGDIELTYEVFDVSTDKDLRLIVYTTQIGSSSEDGLKVLASWTATQAQVGEDLSTRL